MTPVSEIRLILKNTVPYLAVALVIILALIKFYGLQSPDLSYPMTPLSGDGYLSAYVAKALSENSLMHNSRVGAPLGMSYYDFYQPDFVHQAILKVIADITGKPVLAMNLYFLGSFVLIAWSAFYVFQRFHLSTSVSLVCAVLYAFTPSHLYRSYNHLFLSAYYILPIAVLIALRVMLGRSSEREPDLPRTTADQSVQKALLHGQHPLASALGSRLLLFALPIAILIGGSGVYYAFYSMLFIGAASCYAVLKNDWRSGIAGLLCTTVIGLSTGAGMLPKELYDSRAGSSEVGQRSPIEEQIYSLKLAYLFLPHPLHRIRKARAIAAEYITSFPALNANEGEYANLGLVGSIGMFAILLWPFLRVSDDKHSRLMMYLLVLTLVGLLFAMPGGFGSLFALLITPELRAQNRIIFVIAFFALFAFGIIFDKVRRKIPQKPLFLNVVRVVLVLILVAGLYDETFAEMISSQSQGKEAFQRDARFIARIEAGCPSNGMVLELPYQGFPEQPGVNGTDNYGHLRGYIHSQNLRWSFPAMLGRPEDDWIRTLSGNQTPELVRKAAISGYCGIYVDRLGFQDGAAKFESELRASIPSQPLVSEDGLQSFYSLNGYTAALKQRLKPGDWIRLVSEAKPKLIVTMISGIYGPEVDQSGSWRWCKRKGAIEIFNATGQEQKADLSGGVTGWFTQSASVWFKTSDQTVQISASNKGSSFHLPLILRPGENCVSFRTDSPRVTAPLDSRELYFRMSGVSLSQH